MINPKIREQSKAVKKTSTCSVPVQYICRVYTIGASGQKLITIPKGVPIHAGDFVKIVKMRLIK